MNFIYPICSSSKGNATYIGSREYGILIDCGIGIRSLSNALKLNNIPLSAIQAVFVTHEHGDHIKGLSKLGENIPFTLYGNVPTLREVIDRGGVGSKVKLKEINRKPATVCDMLVQPFHTSHDSADSMGYHVTLPNGKRFCLCTDLGYVSEEVSSHLKNSDFVLLESNYEESLLLNGSYPPYLKERIRGRQGHLSNADCSAALKRLLETGVCHFMLGHLSEENNRPELALSVSATALTEAGAKIGTDCSLAVAPRMTVGKVVEL